MSDAFFSFSLHAVDPDAAAPFLFADSIADDPRDLLSSVCACIWFHPFLSQSVTVALCGFTLHGVYTVPNVAETCAVPPEVRDAEAARLASHRLQEYVFVTLAESLQLED